jgi:hypothetical protein
MGGCCCKERTENKITIETENNIDKIKTNGSHGLLNPDYLDACEEVLDTINNKYKDDTKSYNVNIKKSCIKNKLPIGVMVDCSSDDESTYETPRSYASI